MLAHRLAEKYRQSGEWFDLSAQSASEFILEVAKQLVVRYEVEDRAGIYDPPPSTYKESL